MTSSHSEGRVDVRMAAICRNLAPNATKATKSCGWGCAAQCVGLRDFAWTRWLVDGSRRTKACGKVVGWRRCVADSHCCIQHSCRRSWRRTAACGACSYETGTQLTLPRKVRPFIIRFPMSLGHRILQQQQNQNQNLLGTTTRS